MGRWEDRGLPWLIDKLGDEPEMRVHRDEVCQGLYGTVLEIGFGSGLNIPHYPPEVERVLAVDPAMYGRELAAERLAASPIPVEFIGLDGQSIPLPDNSVDCALSTLTLCTIADAGAALAEIARVLRPGGALHYLEHGLADDEVTQRRQRRITPIWRRVFGGCRLDRPIHEILADAGYAVDGTTFGADRLRIVAFRSKGRATPAL